MKNTLKNSWKKGAGRFVVHTLLLLTTTLFLPDAFALSDSTLSSKDTSFVPPFIAESDTSSVYDAVPVSMIMGIPASTFWTYFAMGAGLIVVVTIALVSSVSKSKQKR